MCLQERGPFEKVVGPWIKQVPQDHRYISGPDRLVDVHRWFISVQTALLSRGCLLWGEIAIKVEEECGGELVEVLVIINLNQWLRYRSVLLNAFWNRILLA